MDIRNEFKNQGECYFPIKSIDEEFHNYLSEHYKCNETKNLHDMWTNQDDNGFKFHMGEIIEQGKEVHHVVEHGSFDELELKKNELVEKYKEEKYKDWKCNQLWYYNTTPKPIITTGINNIVRYLYDLDDDVEFSDVDQVLLTLYNEHCRFVQHSDGPQAGYMCSVVIYLNENYDVSSGGLFDGEQ